MDMVSSILHGQSAQFSSGKPATFRKSFKFRVTNMARLASAMAAISKSARPIFFSFSPMAMEE
jgi:hypothetical protein